MPNKKKKLKNQQLLGKTLIILALLLIPLMLLRFPQIAALMQAFESFGRVPDAIQFTQLYVFGEIVLLVAGLALGEFFRTRKMPISLLLTITALMFLAWQIYRLITDIFILISLRT